MSKENLERIHLSYSVLVVGETQLMQSVEVSDFKI